MSELLEYPEEVEAIQSAYPDSRATREHLARLAMGNDYSRTAIEPPFRMEMEGYRQLTYQTEAILRIYEKIAAQYLSDSLLRRYVDAALLQFEKPAVRELVENYPLATSMGSQYASDVLLSDEGPMTVEINVGPVGGPPDIAAAQRRYPDIRFPLETDLIIDHICHSVGCYYEQACESIGCNAVPFAEREVVYVENDGYYSGSFGLVEGLRERGMKIQLLPREALYQDPKDRRLKVKGSDISVDQIILDYHLQEDPDIDIARAISEKRVVAESSPFAQIVLGSKVMLGIVSQLVTDPDGVLARRLGLEPDELTDLEGFLPPTHQWRA
jgi:hypothetical protein